MPEAESAESNQNSLSGPRHTPLDTRPANDRVSPPTPDAPSAPVGTHTNNPGSLPQRSAPGSTGSPFVLPGREPSVFPTASASHSPSECKRVAPPAADRSSCAAIPESLPETPLRLGLTRQSARSRRHPLRVRLCCPAPVPTPFPIHPSGRSGRITHKTGTSVPAWPFGPAFVSVEKLSPAPPALSPFPASPFLRLPQSPDWGFRPRCFLLLLHLHVFSKSPWLHGRCPASSLLRASPSPSGPLTVMHSRGCWAEHLG